MICHALQLLLVADDHEFIAENLAELIELKTSLTTVSRTQRLIRCRIGNESDRYPRHAEGFVRLPDRRKPYQHFGSALTREDAARGGSAKALLRSVCTVIDAGDEHLCLQGGRQVVHGTADRHGTDCELL
jgi:hypothetical protein